jgi:hypothetical protein
MGVWLLGWAGTQEDSLSGECNLLYDNYQRFCEHRGGPARKWRPALFVPPYDEPGGSGA